MSKDLKVISYKVFDIDVDTDSHDEVKLDKMQSASLLRFIVKLAYDTSTAKSTRIATFNKDSLCLNVLSEFGKLSTSTKNLEKIAKKLIKAEKEQNKRSGHLNPIKPGNLIVAKFERDSEIKIIVSKIEFEGYLAKETFKEQEGIPKEKGLLKSCLLNVIDEKLQENITLADSNTNIATFWYQGFLDSTFIRDNALNTQKAITSIESQIAFIKEISKDDYLELKECIGAYFLSNNNFDFDELKKKLTVDFKPKSDKLNLDQLKAKLNKLKDKNTFDGTFEIDKSEVKKTVKKTYKLDNEVTVIAKSGTSNIYKTTKDNSNYIVIKTDYTPPDLKDIDLS
jgi:hypothetical protein